MVSSQDKSSWPVVYMPIACWLWKSHLGWVTGKSLSLETLDRDAAELVVEKEITTKMVI